MGPKRTPKQHHKILCVLCKFSFEDASALAKHLCSVHTGLDDGESQNDGGGYFVCAKCGNQKKRKRRKEFHNVDRERHHCYTLYLLDEDKDFYYAEVIVGVTLARRLAKRAYQMYGEEVDVEALDQWLPRRTRFGDAVPHVEEYHAGDHKQKSTHTFGEAAVLAYIKLKEFDLGKRGKKGDDALSPGVSVTDVKDKGGDDALSPGVSVPKAKDKGGDDALSPEVSAKGASKTKPVRDAKTPKRDVSKPVKEVPNPLYKGDTSSLPGDGDVSAQGSTKGGNDAPAVQESDSDSNASTEPHFYPRGNSIKDNIGFSKQALRSANEGSKKGGGTAKKGGNTTKKTTEVTSATRRVRGRSLDKDTNLSRYSKRKRAQDSPIRGRGKQMEESTKPRKGSEGTEGKIKLGKQIKGKKSPVQHKSKNHPKSKQDGDVPTIEGKLQIMAGLQPEPNPGVAGKTLRRVSPRWNKATGEQGTEVRSSGKTVTDQSKGVVVESLKPVAPVRSDKVAARPSDDGSVDPLKGDQSGKVDITQRDFDNESPLLSASLQEFLEESNAGGTPPRSPVKLVTPCTSPPNKRTVINLCSTEREDLRVTLNRIVALNDKRELKRTDAIKAQGVKPLPNPRPDSPIMLDQQAARLRLHAIMESASRASAATAASLERKRRLDQDRSAHDLCKKLKQGCGPSDGGSQKPEAKGGQLPQQGGATATAVREMQHPGEVDVTGALNVLQGDWQGQLLDQTPNIRHLCAVHVLAPSNHPIRVTNIRKVDCFRITARVKATGAVVAVEAPCAVGSPAAIFRDCPELEPYFPAPTTLPWLNTARYVGSVQLMATTWSRSTRAERERMGLVPEDHDDVLDI